MTYLKTYLIIITSACAVIAGCEPETIIKDKIVNTTDTLYNNQTDTIFDTTYVVNYDTIFQIDTVIQNDTIFRIDTIYVDTAYFAENPMLGTWYVDYYRLPNQSKISGGDKQYVSFNFKRFTVDTYEADSLEVYYYLNDPENLKLEYFQENGVPVELRFNFINNYETEAFCLSSDHNRNEMTWVMKRY